MSKSVMYKKEITDIKLIKEIKNYIKHSDDIKISVYAWDYINYNIDSEDCELTLEIYIELNDNNDTQSFYIIEIPQTDIPQNQYEDTCIKVLKDCAKIGNMIKKEFAEIYNYDDELKKVEIIVYDTLQYC